MARLLDQTADTILYNGRIITMDAEQPRATAVAVRAGQVVGVGDDADLRPLVGRHTERIDLGRRAVIPGLIDTHNHMSTTGLGMLHVALEAAVYTGRDRRMWRRCRRCSRRGSRRCRVEN